MSLKSLAKTLPNGTGKRRETAGIDRPIRTIVYLYDLYMENLTMSSLETLRVKLISGGYNFAAQPLTLTYDPRHGQDMPALVNGGKFLQDLREEVRNRPAPIAQAEARSRARSCHFDMYLWACPSHGETGHHTQSGRCAACQREPSEPTYIGSCVVHGDVPHSAARRLCLGCYNTLGKPRPLATNPTGWYVDRAGKIIQIGC
jgi:hypothetical protein